MKEEVKKTKKARPAKKLAKIPKPVGPGSRPQGGLGTKKAAKKPVEVVMPEPQEKAGGEKPGDFDAKDKKPVAKDGEPRPEGRDRYFEAVGRRKTSIARVRMYTRTGDFVVNNKPYGNYFSTLELQRIAEDALQKMKLLGRFRVSARITGGGTHSQAEALRHGLARVLVKFNPDFRKRLKRAGFLTRDPRMKERKKFGLKRARRAPQWAKR